MSKQCLNVLLVEDDAEYAMLVQQWLITTVYDWVVLDVGRFETIPRSVGGARMDLVLVSSAAIPSLHAAKQIRRGPRGAKANMCIS